MSKIERLKNVCRFGFGTLLGIVGSVGGIVTYAGLALTGLSLDAMQHNNKNHNTLMYTKMMFEKIKEDINEVSENYADVEIDDLFEKMGIKS